MELDSSTLVVQSDTVITSDLDGEILMMSIQQGEYYSLKNVSAFIWNAIEQPIEVSMLCKLLLAEFDIDNKTCENEVFTFIENLNELDMVSLT